MISARCDHGPYDGRSLHHARPAYRVPYERHRPSKSIPGSLREADEHIAIGAYVFHPLTEKWHWFADIAGAPITPRLYAVWITEPPRDVPSGM